MDAPSASLPPGASVSADVSLRAGTHELEMHLTVPAGPATPRQLLPLLRGLTHALVDVAVADAAHAGASVSCRKGCGACCRQLVPIAPAEAHAIAALVDAMPEPQRAQVRARFAAAAAALAADGLLDRLRAPARMGEAQRRRLGLEYFRRGVPCPFLVDESCSIHPERPLACREYLVVSPAAHCADPVPDRVACVPLPAHVSRALRKVDAAEGDGQLPWVPLVLALEWASAHPEPAPTQTGPELVRQVFDALTGAGSP